MKAKDEFAKFAESTSAHGVGYISSPSYIERTFWLVATLTSLVYCLTTITGSIKDWNQKRYDVRLESFSFPARASSSVGY